MGCDIHGTIEKKVGGEWVMVNRLHYSGDSTTRHYKRFAALAGVRGNGPSPKGIPGDVSASTKLYIDEWGLDGHSHTFYPIKEAADIYLNTVYENETRTDYQKKHPVSAFFDIDAAGSDLDNYRCILWFDN